MSADQSPLRHEHARVDQSAAVVVDLREDGVLYEINRVLFHPRGFALAMHPGTEPPAFVLLGDGSEPWHFADDGRPPTNAQRAAAFEALLNRGRGTS